MAAESHKPLIVAHRGASGLAPENTLAAFDAAIRAGADGIELDVHLSRDGHVVVHHDYEISKEWARLHGDWLGETGPALRDLTLAEIQAYDVGRLRPNSAYERKYPDYTPADGARIPTLAEALGFILANAPASLQLWVELKLAPPDQAPTSDAEALTEATLAVLQEHGALARTVLISFYWPSLYHAQRLAPGLKTGYLSAERSWLNNIRRAQQGASPWTAPADIDDHAGSIPAMIAAMGGVAWSVYQGDLTEARLQDAHARGLKVGVWTVRERYEGLQAIELGVDVITTDRPDWFTPR